MHDHERARTGTGTPYPPSVKHGGKPPSVKHGGKIALVENKTRPTPWCKTKWVRLPGGKQNFAGGLVENKTHSVKQNHSAQKITLSVKQK